jgi:hypothetical protein
MKDIRSAIHAYRTAWSEYQRSPEVYPPTGAGGASIEERRAHEHRRRIARAEAGLIESLAAPRDPRDSVCCQGVVYSLEEGGRPSVVSVSRWRPVERLNKRQDLDTTAGLREPGPPAGPKTWTGCLPTPNLAEAGISASSTGIGDARPGIEARDGLSLASEVRPGAPVPAGWTMAQAPPGEPD